MKGRAREESSSRSTRTPSSSSFARSIRCNNPRQTIRSKERNNLVSVRRGTIESLWFLRVGWRRCRSNFRLVSPCNRASRSLFTAGDAKGSSNGKKELSQQLHDDSRGHISYIAIQLYCNSQIYCKRKQPILPQLARYSFRTGSRYSLPAYLALPGLTCRLLLLGHHRHGSRSLHARLLIHPGI